MEKNAHMNLDILKIHHVMSVRVLQVTARDHGVNGVIVVLLVVAEHKVEVILL